MLEGEVDARGNGEVGIGAAELPEDGAGRTVEFEDGCVVACGDEVVSVAVFVNAVDVEVVVGVEGGAGVEGAGWF